MNELILNIKQDPGVIELNFDEIEKALDEKLAEYRGAVFTEESKSVAKKEVASLRKFKSKFEDARKSVKREWMKPYDEFETRATQVIQVLLEPKVIRVIRERLATASAVLQTITWQRRHPAVLPHRLPDGRPVFRQSPPARNTCGIMRWSSIPMVPAPLHPHTSSACMETLERPGRRATKAILEILDHRGLRETRAIQALKVTKEMTGRMARCCMQQVPQRQQPWQRWQHWRPER